MSKKIKAAIIGSGNIGTDLMIKILRNGQNIEMGVMVGIDEKSDGLARANRMGVATTAEGVEGLVKMPEFADIDVVFDATSAGAHRHNDVFLRGYKEGIKMIDLTPAAIGPYCVLLVARNHGRQYAHMKSMFCESLLRMPFTRPSHGKPNSSMKYSMCLNVELTSRSIPRAAMWLRSWRSAGVSCVMMSSSLKADLRS